MHENLELKCISLVFLIKLIFHIPIMFFFKYYSKIMEKSNLVA